MPTQLDRIEQMLEDLLDRTGGNPAVVSIENEIAMVRARGGDPAKYLKEKWRRQMEADRKLKKSRRTAEGAQRPDECINIPVSWRLTRLAKAWDSPLVGLCNPPDANCLMMISVI